MTRYRGIAPASLGSVFRFYLRGLGLASLLVIPEALALGSDVAFKLTPIVAIISLTLLLENDRSRRKRNRTSLPSQEQQNRERRTTEIPSIQAHTINITDPSIREAVERESDFGWIAALLAASLLVAGMFGIGSERNQFNNSSLTSNIFSAGCGLLWAAIVIALFRQFILSREKARNLENVHLSMQILLREDLDDSDKYLLLTIINGNLEQNSEPQSTATSPKESGSRWVREAPEKKQGA